MRILRRVLVGTMAIGLAGCGGGSSPAPSAPTSVQPAPQPTAFEVKGFVYDTAFRAVPGASVEVIDGSQAGTSTTADGAGAFTLTGTFTGRTQFRASKEGYVTKIQAYDVLARSSTVLFVLDVAGGSVDISGEYSLNVIADSACADQLPSAVRTRTYDARIGLDRSPPATTTTRFFAALSGAELDSYYNRMLILVAGDYLNIDLSDNYIVEEVGPEAYLSIGGVGNASVATSGVSTITASFSGVFDYCVLKSEPQQGAPYTCVPAEAVAHAECGSAHHRFILTRR